MPSSCLKEKKKIDHGSKKNLCLFRKSIARAYVLRSRLSTRARPPGRSESNRRKRSRKDRGKIHELLKSLFSSSRLSTARQPLKKKKQECSSPSPARSARPARAPSSALPSRPRPPTLMSLSRPRYVSSFLRVGRFCNSEKNRRRRCCRRRLVSARLLQNSYGLAFAPDRRPATSSPLRSGLNSIHAASSLS